MDALVVPGSLPDSTSYIMMMGEGRLRVDSLVSSRYPSRAEERRNLVPTMMTRTKSGYGVIRCSMTLSQPVETRTGEQASASTA
eukprot:scaffold7234_cov335-Prasinococcus_capsulatus_cf.AAC.12